MHTVVSSSSSLPPVESASDALQLLDNEFAALADGVAEGRYSLWLGSGISLGRVDGLSRVLPRVLEFLRNEASQPDPRGHDKALKDALRLAKMPEDDIAKIDLRAPFNTWPGHNDVVDSLIDKYALLLAIPVDGQEVDYLLWEGVRIADTFPESAEPDCEHLCIAALILEGVLPQIASANWDGLVEAAMSELDPRDSILQVCVLPEELRLPAGRSQLLKFHGCAVKAVRNEAVYRPRLIGRQPQITGWSHAPEHAPMRSKLRDMAVTRPTLMVGLSAQDSDIQELFSEASNLMRWPWPSMPPAHVFSEYTLSPMQQNILQSVYTEAVYARNSQAIEESARFPAHGKPLLAALLLHVLSQKLTTLLRALIPASYSPTEVLALATGIQALRDLAASSGFDGQWSQFIGNLLVMHSRAMSILRTGRYDALGTRRYQPLGTVPAGQISLDPTLATSGEPEFAGALAIIGLGHARKHWSMSDSTSPEVEHGTTRLATPAKEYRLFFVANEGAATQLVRDGAIADTDDDAVLVYSTTPSPARTRSPSTVFGRTGVASPRSVHMRDLVMIASSADDLLREFELAGGLV